MRRVSVPGGLEIGGAGGVRHRPRSLPYGAVR